MIVGGTAVALHGCYRDSQTVTGEIAKKPDLDFWYITSYTNYFRLLGALESLGIDVSAFREEKSPNPKESYFRYEFEKFSLDFLPELKASLKFSPCFTRRGMYEIGDTETPFINYEDLILDKKANPRSKDITDLNQLKINRNKNKL